MRKMDALLQVLHQAAASPHGLSVMVIGDRQAAAQDLSNTIRVNPIPALKALRIFSPLEAPGEVWIFKQPGGAQVPQAAPVFAKPRVPDNIELEDFLPDA